jgi:hypothetical protein
VKDELERIRKEISQNSPVGTEKTTINHNKDSRFPGRDLNPRPPEYEAGPVFSWMDRGKAVNSEWLHHVMCSLCGVNETHS